MVIAQENTSADIKSEAPAPAVKPAAARAEVTGLAKTLGEFAHRNRDFFTSRGGELFFRNFLNVVVNVVPTVITFMLTRHVSKAYMAFAEKNPERKTTKLLSPFLDAKNQLVGWQATFIFTGFTVFRAGCRMGRRLFDRVFSLNNKDANDTAQAISDIPSNLVKDFKEIIMPEIAGVMVGCIPLSAVKSGYLNPQTFQVSKGDWEQVKKGFTNDWLASVPAYFAFFESADRIYSAVSGGKDTPEYYRKLKGLPEKEKPANPKYGFFTDDGVGSLAFRRGGSLFVGVAAWMGLQRIGKAKFGSPDMSRTGFEGFMRNTFREYTNFVGFAGYTVLSDVYNQSYDGLFQQMEAKNAGRGR